MFTLGITLIMIGAVLRIYLKMKAHHVSRTLAPRFVYQRDAELDLLKSNLAPAIIASNLLLISGIAIVLVTAVFN